jgi:hypothetical protein
MRARDVPMKVLGFHIEREHVGEQHGERACDVLDGVRFQIGRRLQRSLPQFACGWATNSFVVSIVGLARFVEAIARQLVTAAAVKADDRRSGIPEAADRMLSGLKAPRVLSSELPKLDRFRSGRPTDPDTSRQLPRLAALW